MGCCNPRWVFPINTCGRHESSNNEQPRATNTSRFCLFHCCTAKATSSRPLMCICDRDNRSPKPSSSAILHQERANKVFRKQSSWLLARFFKFFTMAHLPLRQMRAESHHLQCELLQADHHLDLIVVKEPQVTYGSCSQIMSYILNMLICASMILLDNLLQCLLFIAKIDLSRTCSTADTLIYNALVMFMIYPWIKSKLKMLIFPSSSSLSV
jgi:hypothetical protein